MLLAKSLSAAAAIDVAQLVPARGSHFTALVGSRVAVHDAKLCFEVASVQPIGLAFYEIATDAGKYRGAVYGYGSSRYLVDD
jgi:hypothetical protein